jgi:hypothetical protein
LTMVITQTICFGAFLTPISVSRRTIFVVFV